MRDYDKLREERDLNFKLRGQEFTIHLLRLQMWDVWNEREEKVKATDSVANRQMLIDRVADAVADENGSEARWRELCDSDDSPAYGELVDVANWVLQAQADLPTKPSAPSAPGRGKTVASSTDG